MRRLIPVAVAAAALVATQLPATSTALAAPAPDAVSAVSGVAAKVAGPKVRTKFALRTVAYGTRVDGGSLPAGSSATAYDRISCTNQTGRERVNFVADQVIPGLGKAEGIRTRVWTAKKGNRVSAYSMHQIAKLTIGNPSVGALEITGLKSVSEAFNDNGRYGTTFDSEVARIVLKAGTRVVASYPIPSPKRALTIPGLLRIALGTAERRTGPRSADVFGNALEITVLPTGTKARVAQTNARIAGGIEQGVFNGYSAGVEARALADNTRVGRQPLNPLPCRGSDLRVERVAGVNLGSLGGLRGVAATAQGTNRPRVARGTVTGSVAQASLLDGRVRIEGIKAVATAQRKDGKLTRSSEGSTVLDVTIDGRKFSFPALGKITIPGLVELDDEVVEKTQNGLKVIGLRVKVLNGTGAVVDLGVAQIGVRPGVSPKKRR
ncbi:choice-of-anchor P family protein [Nocardioides litoris]|uniref:choice-of-anchor P family protein n=1 Tax=Nocardioides litoris TaxID=1926648 RepID=UPI00111F00DA|nr:choice-of-anchor P family protein [Nocardioides litoris]